MKQNHSINIKLLAPLAVVFFSLVAAGCTSSKSNTLDRPISETDVPYTSDNGEVAGADVMQLPTKNIKVAGRDVQVEVADTFEAQAQGLSGRAKLDDGTGMLFDFANADSKKPGFWMKDMLISIDIIWIGEGGKIIDIEASVPLPPKDGDLPLYYPPSEITHVLEVPASWSARNNVKVGDEIKI